MSQVRVLLREPRAFRDRRPFWSRPIHKLEQESDITYASVFRFAALAAAIGFASAAHAQSDPYHITATEKAACTADAIRFCSDAYPDEQKLVSCMSSNRSSLTRVCRVVFDAGLRRRRIVSR